MKRKVKKYKPKPQSLANLKPWKAGDPSPNPGGRPKKRQITDEYAQILSEAVPERLRLQFNQQLGEQVLRKGAIWARAGALRRALDSLMEGGWSASREMREALEGKAPLRLEIQGTERKEITIRVLNDRTKELISSTLNIPSTSSTPLKSNGNS